MFKKITVRYKQVTDIRNYWPHFCFASASCRQPSHISIVLAEHTMAPLTSTQEKIAAVIPIFAGSLSILASSVLLYTISRKRKNGTFQRLVGILSCVDIVSSLSLVVTAFLLPAEGGRVWSFGNTASCSAIAFFSQCAMASFLYNSSINIYYLLTIVGGISKEVIETFWEPWLHTFALGYPLMTAFLGVYLDLYGETKVGFSCWVDGDDRGVGFIFAAPFILSLIFLLFSNLAIYWKVNQTVSGERTLTRQKTSKRRIQEVGVQATLYVAAAYSAAFANVVVRSYSVAGFTREDESRFYWAIVLGQLFKPLQGVWTFATYIRPRYIQFRRRYKLESCWWCLRNSVCSSTARQPYEPPSTDGTSSSNAEGSTSVVEVARSTPVEANTTAKRMMYNCV